MPSTKALSTTQTKPSTQNFTHDYSNKDFKDMTHEERHELLDNACRKLLHGLFGDNWEDIK